MNVEEIRKEAERVARGDDRFDSFDERTEFPKLELEELATIRELVRLNGYYVEYGLILLVAAFSPDGSTNREIAKLATFYAAVESGVGILKPEFTEEF